MTKFEKKVLFLFVRFSYVLFWLAKAHILFGSSSSTNALARQNCIDNAYNSLHLMSESLDSD